MASQNSTQTHDVDVHVHTCMEKNELSIPEKYVEFQDLKLAKFIWIYLVHTYLVHAGRSSVSRWPSRSNPRNGSNKKLPESQAQVTNLKNLRGVLIFQRKPEKTRCIGLIYSGFWGTNQATMVRFAEVRIVSNISKFTTVTINTVQGIHLYCSLSTLKHKYIEEGVSWSTRNCYNKNVPCIHVYHVFFQDSTGLLN